MTILLGATNAKSNLSHDLKIFSQFSQCTDTHYCSNTAGSYECIVGSDLLVVNSVVNQHLAKKVLYNATLASVDLAFDSDLKVKQSCGITFKNRFLIFGGADNYNRQILEVDQCQLRSIGS